MSNLKITWVLSLISLCSCAQDTPKHKVDPAAKAFNERAMTLYSFIDNIDSAKKAIVLLDSATTIDSDYYLAYYNKLIFSTNIKQFDKALLAANNLIRIRPSVHDFYLTRGFLYYRLGNTNASKSDFQHSLTICGKVLDTMSSKNKNYDYISMDRAISLIMLGQQDKGQQILKQIYNRQTDSSWKKYYGSYLNKNPKQLIELYDSPPDEQESYPVIKN
jgi:tetratricopeptide (TPR) repeat protein